MTNAFCNITCGKDHCTNTSLESRKKKHADPTVSAKPYIALLLSQACTYFWYFSIVIHISDLRILKMKWCFYCLIFKYTQTMFILTCLTSYVILHYLHIDIHIKLSIAKYSSLHFLRLARTLTIVSENCRLKGKIFSKDIKGEIKSRPQVLTEFTILTIKENYRIWWLQKYNFSTKLTEFSHGASHETYQPS